MLTFEHEGVVIKAQLLEFGDDVSYELFYEDMTPVTVGNKSMRVSIHAEKPKDDFEILLRKDKEILLENGEEVALGNEDEDEYERELRLVDEKEALHRKIIQEEIEELYDRRVIRKRVL